MPGYFATVDAAGLVTGFYNDVIADPPPDAFPISDAVWADWIADTANQRWTGSELAPYTPPPPPPPPPVRIIRSLAFRERLGDATRAALTVAAVKAAAAGSGDLLTFLLDQASSTQTDLDDPRVVGGIDALRSQGIITPAEASAMLADGSPAERP